MESNLNRTRLEISMQGVSGRPDLAEGAASEINSILAQAEELEQAERWEEAGHLYREILTHDPAHAEVNHRMGRIAVRMQVPALGLSYFEAAVAADSSNATFWISYIDALAQAGQGREARKLLALACQQGLEGREVAALMARLDRESLSARKPQSLAGKRKNAKGPAKIEFDAMVDCFNRGNHVDAERMARHMSLDYPNFWAGWKMLGVLMMGQGRYAEAQDALEQAVQLAPKDAESHNNLGIALFQRGKIDDAQVSYHRALNVDARYSPAHCNLGAALQAQGRLVEAEASYRRALAINPGYLKALNNLGSVLLDLKKFEAAETCYRQALEFKVADAESYRNLGVALNAAGRPDEAEVDLHRAIALDANDAANYCSLAAIQAAQGKPADAEASLMQALAINPDLADANEDLGVLLLDLRRYNEAESRLLKAIECRPESFVALNNLGICYKKQGRLAEAEKMIRRALEIRPNSAEGLNNLGGLLRKMNRLEDSAATLRKSLEISAEAGLAHLNLGVSLKALDRLEEAGACFTRAARLGIEMARIRNALLLPSIMGTEADVRSSRLRFETAVDQLLADPPVIADPQDCFGEPNFYLAYHGCDDRDLQVKVARMYAASCPSLIWSAPHCSTPEALATRKIRVAFYSKYLFNHSVSTCYSRLIIGLSQDERFELCLITDGGVDRSIYAGFQGRIVEVPDNLVHAREAIADLMLDALLYLDIGMEPMSYFLAFSRLAPMQCVMAGHPVTTGIGTIDCFLSSAVFEAEDADSHYSEALVRFSVPLVCYGRPEVPPALKSRTALGLPDAGRLYMCPMKLQKLHPDFDLAISRILELDQDGKVILFEDGMRKHWREMLEARFVRTIPQALRERIVFLPWIADYKDFVAAVIHADVLLDPFHFGIGSTIVVVGVTGTPVLTKPGKFMRSRMGAYYNDLLEIGECTLADTETYARKAVEIATSPAVRASLTQRILRNGHRIYDDSRAVGDLSEFLLRR